MSTMLLLGVALLGGALLLIILEAFVPSGGLLGALAATAAIAGIVCLFRYDTLWGLSGLLCTLILGPTAFFWVLRILPSTPIGRTMFGADAEEVGEQTKIRAQSERDSHLALVGSEGVAITDLRPVGTVQIDGKRYDALAQGGAIDRGQHVRVSGADRMQIKVRALRDA